MTIAGSLRSLSTVLATFVVVACGSGHSDRSGSLLDRFERGEGGLSRGAGGWLGLGPSEPRGPVSDPGTGSFLSERAPAVSMQPTATGGQGFQLNLVDAPIPAAANFVLGEALGLNYVVDPGITGTVTLQTSEPVSREALIDIFEATLAANGLAIVETAGVYRIVAASDAIAGTPPVSVPSSEPGGPGVRVLVVPLRYIAAEEMRDILVPISPPGAVLRFDAERNYLMLTGNSAEMTAMLDAISVFDVDSMRGMSVALHPLEDVSPTEVASELQAIFGTGNTASDVIRFVPNEQLNSLLVITSQPEYLARAAEWIAQLDRVAESAEEQLFVYPVQNRPAEELAEVLLRVLEGESALDAGPISPDLGEVEVVTGDVATAEFEGLEATEELAALGSMVVADSERNALLINATASEYRELEPILRRLDTPATQVLLEAMIVEVVLNDTMRFGVRWFLENGDSQVRFSDVFSGAVGPSFPGFGWNVTGDDFEVTLNALSSVTDVEVISAPTLMALNNQEAVLQIGDQVPIVTQTATSVIDDDARIVNSVELRDTGIILNVIPRVNSSGGVLLDVEQEASRVVETTTSEIDSPTIQQRRIRTRVSLRDGETLVLGGLIQEGTTRNQEGVPFLSDIPFLGAAFRSRRDRLDRTELLIFVRPRVVRDVEESRRASAEFRRRLGFGQSETAHDRMLRNLERLR